jgi:glutamate/tyrosine decarboxylase-like PLP-dependent enzyme
MIDHTTDELLADAAVRGRRYVGGVGDRPVAPEPAAVDALACLAGPLPRAGRPAEQVLELLDRVGSPATVASAGPRYFGFVTGGALPIAVAAAWLTAAWDQNCALRNQSPVGVALDDVALGWVADLVGLPPGTGGGFVTGATMANATCLAAARDAVLASAGWDAEARGLAGAPPVQVVVSGEVHATVLKALGFIGLGRDALLRLPVDGQGRIRAEGLPPLRRPAIVCLQAGNVNTGASDPFGPLIEWAHGEGAWVHVDGAFGLWAAAAPAVAGQVRGMQDADSWATDAHKWLNTTYDSGIALVRDAALLRRAMLASAAYLTAGAQREPMEYTPQSSQRARAVECWAVLSHLGRDGVAGLVERSCEQARRFAEGLRAAGHTVLNDVVLNQVLVTFGDATDATGATGATDATDAVIAAVQRDGTCWCGPTTWQGHRAMRISVSCWATTHADVDRSVEAVCRAALAVRGSSAR